MRNARPSTDAIVNSGSSICFTVPTKTRTKLAGDIPNTTAESSAANRHDVPGADSQLKLYMAAYGVVAFTTGAVWLTWLCNPGHANLIVCISRLALTGLVAHTRTKATSSRYGSHA